MEVIISHQIPLSQGFLLWFKTPRAPLPFSFPYTPQGLSPDKTVVETTLVAHWDLVTTWPTEGHQPAALIRVSLEPRGPVCPYFISAGASARLRLTFHSLKPQGLPALHLWLLPLSTSLCFPTFLVEPHKSPRRKKMLC